MTTQLYNYPLINNLNNIIIAGYKNINEPKSLIHVVAYRQNLLEITTFFKLSSIYNYDIAVDALAVDVLENEYRFTVTYLIQSSTNNSSIRLETKTTENLFLISLQGIFPAFNWAEREIWDLSGIFFIKHPDLRRILTDYGFSGHPLRKDFPISGFKEVQYSDILKQIVYNSVELSQSLRLINTFPSWDNEKTL